jgi:hypothetical protein
MKIYKTLSYFIYLITIVSFILPETLSAIPAFARRHKVSCTTCHTVFPKLKDYGDEFAGNGFIMKESEKARDYVSAGDDLLWLNKDFPLAARMEAFATHDQGKEVENDLQVPWGIKLLSGGTLYKNIGYYFYFYMSERGEVAGVEDAYIHFDNVFGSNLDVMVGQFQTSDPLMKRELRLTYEDYEIYKTRIGKSGTNLAYDRGVMLVYGIDQTGTDVIGMVVNGNGAPAGGENRKLDQDNYKNLGFRVNQNVADLFSIGGFYYAGKEQHPDSSRTNEITYFGPDINFGTDFLDVTAQYIYRKDTNADFLASEIKFETNGYIFEVNFAPDLEKSRYYFTALYNLVDSDNYKYETMTLSATYQIARNLRFLAEYTRDLELEKNRMVLGIIGAF